MSTYTLISSQVLGSSAASVTFSSIPQTYKDLVLRVSPRGDAAVAAVSLYYQLNSDSATNYSYTRVYGNGATATSSNSSSATTQFLGNVTAASSTAANTFSNIEVYIPNYTSTSSRPVSSFSAQEDNATSPVYIMGIAGLYRGSSAISSIVLTLSSGNFVTGSSFYLYGI